MLLFGEFETFRALGPYYQRHGFTVLDSQDTIDVGTLLTGMPMRLGGGAGQAGGSGPALATVPVQQSG
ncbi:hypothetical protein [Streptomyces adustus]|uniref:hypothetical protein n=1 Tax=Streptomyces adustus TaxID=1609272 RepID=UPI00192E45B7|nr:hypothetical protein [Streptomyces adustus]